METVMLASPPDVDLCMCGWEKDIINTTLRPIGIPSNVEAAPPSVLKSIKCTCLADNACSSGRCSCAAADILCTMISNCDGKHLVCHNPKNTSERSQHDGEDLSVTNDDE